MPESTPELTRNKLWPFSFLIPVFILPVIISLLVYQLDSFDPAPYPAHELTQEKPLFVPATNGHMLRGSEKIGEGELMEPEDIAYDPETGVIYTGCVDGWVKRVTVNESAADSVVEKWVNTGGRPLGVLRGRHGEVIVADADKGLLNITRDGKIQLLTDEAEGVKFKLTDAVDITQDGKLYFTDASYKYSLKENIWDFLEGKPYGRFMSYDPSTKKTQVLVRNLFFANGVAVSPDEEFVIFCESPMWRCKRYYLKGEKKGSVDIFIDNLPGMPDNILYDGEGLYWIALAMEKTFAWDLAQRFPFIRKMVAIMEKYLKRPNFEKNGGVLSVNLEGKPVARYYDQDLSMTSSGIKIGEHLYCGSIVLPYMLRLNLRQYPAVPAT